MKLKLDNFILRLESKANIQNHKINQQKSLKVLTIEQLKEYETMGFLAIESFVENEWLSSLKEITYKMIEESRRCGISLNTCVGPKNEKWKKTLEQVLQYDVDLVSIPKKASVWHVRKLSAGVTSFCFV